MLCRLPSPNAFQSRSAGFTLTVHIHEKFDESFSGSEWSIKYSRITIENHTAQNYESISLAYFEFLKLFILVKYFHLADCGKA